MPDWSYEIAAGLQHGQIICGVDEVGRGPLAGPVLACAAILDPDRVPPELLRRLDDSKKLSGKARSEIALALREVAIFAIAEASVLEIDTINILRASQLAMRRAVDALPQKPSHALVDGNLAPGLSCNTTCIVKGDSKSLSIAAASILAKVERDKIMSQLAETHTVYGWERNAGYGTAHHLDAIKTHGITPHHRRSFRPVSENITITN
ncbi:ribonuclease HII [Dongia mobilis]|uniref:ribonuclease HII n=1 Tax=Dongia sp. TaxID=1977262 RepID=UPI0026EDE6FC